MLIQGLGEAWAHTCNRGTSLSSQESARKLGRSGCIWQAQERWGGLILSRLEESRKNLLPNATGTCHLPGTCKRSRSSFSPCWGAGLWIQSSILWPCCISKGASAGQILLPSSHAEYGLLTDAEVQGSTLCTLLSPASLRAGATLLCVCSERCKVAPCHWITPHHFVQKALLHYSHCLMEVSQPTLLFGDFDLVLIDFEGYCNNFCKLLQLCNFCDIQLCMYSVCVQRKAVFQDQKANKCISTQSLFFKES